jgi:hypothetical protein
LIISSLAISSVPRSLALASLQCSLSSIASKEQC